MTNPPDLRFCRSSERLRMSPKDLIRPALQLRIQDDQSMGSRPERLAGYGVNSRVLHGPLTIIRFPDSRRRFRRGRILKMASCTTPLSRPGPYHPVESPTILYTHGAVGAGLRSDPIPRCGVFVSWMDRTRTARESIFSHPKSLHATKHFPCGFRNRLESFPGHCHRR
jgi:hypothetical protein